MNIGFSHISKSCKDIDYEVKNLVVHNFEQKFVSRYLPNHSNKKSVFRGKNFPNTHSIGLFHNTDGAIIELIEYENISEKTCTRYNIDGKSIMIKANMIDTEIMFWKNALKCKEISTHHLRFSSFIADWSCDFYFQKTEHPLEKPMLNDSGFNCVAFYVKDIDVFISRIMSYNSVMEVAPFPIKVNNKNLRVAMVRSPDGNIIELIEIIHD
jgi:hypothetical protein